MSDPTKVIDDYIASWNETDPQRRKAVIARVWADAGAYRDPLMASDGHAGIDAMIAGVQGRFAGLAMKRVSRIDSHNGQVRFSWALAPENGPAMVEGVDFGVLAADGRLASIAGFIDKMPAA
jgi:hypothetical protein